MAYDLDNSWEIPEGFQPRYSYPDGNTPTKEIGYLILMVDAREECDREKLFQVGAEKKIIPALPIKDHGKLWHMGWDIPTRYVIDAKNQVWMDNAHGGALGLDTIQSLLGAAEEPHEKQRLQKLLGMKVDPPEWIRIARQNGWTPPIDWKEP